MKEKTKQKSFDSIALLLFEQALIQEGVKQFEEQEENTRRRSSRMEEVLENSALFGKT